MSRRIKTTQKVERQFGRHHSPDDRDRRFPLQAKRTERISRHWNSSGFHGDQGAASACVGFGWCHWLHCAPFRQFLNPFGIYEMAKYLDEWDGTNYDGTSVRGGAKLLQQLGFIGEYRWATRTDVIAAHILTSGPVVVGTDWYEGMDSPESNRLMVPEGDNLGGHCYLLDGYSSRTGLFHVKNSWGTSWAQNGYAWIHELDLQALLNADGEACVGIELDNKAVNFQK